MNTQSEERSYAGINRRCVCVLGRIAMETNCDDGKAEREAICSIFKRVAGVINIVSDDMQGARGRREAGRLATALAVPPRAIVAEGGIEFRDSFLEIRTQELGCDGDNG